ncbi:SUKH-4 family immunity protein [Actinoplanes sp. NPDC051851]|uniref:SUKH-4 family immunity protein n=1 Tax=Actinoplanes sp. NPDC051851 TaxID=3154753 RepID=UPI00341FD8BC
MSVSYAELQSLWGDRNLIHFPLDRFDGVLGPLGPEVFPPDGAQPVDVPILFTALIDHPQIAVFTHLELEFEGEKPGSLIVLGSAPGNAVMLFCLDAISGEVLLLDLDTAAIEVCNGTYATFVEFLFRLGQLIATDPGGRERAERARELHDRLRALDPAAFEDPESWWSAAFLRLESTGSQLES